MTSSVISSNKSMLTCYYIIHCAYCLIPQHPPAGKVNQCPSGLGSERVCAALILRPQTCIQSITIGNIKRLEITTYCSKKKTSDLTLFRSKICMKKLHTNRHSCLFDIIKNCWLAWTGRRAMTLCVERDGEGADLWRHSKTSAVIGSRVLLIFSFRLIRLYSYHRLWCTLRQLCSISKMKVNILLGGQKHS